jgi:hypothetical protein
MKHDLNNDGSRQGRISLPTWETYCDNTTAANALVFDLGDSLRVWFSYKTPVAFMWGSTRWVRKNDWKQTTGKHLNAIDGGSHAAKRARTPTAEFEARLSAALKGEEWREPDAFCHYCDDGPYLASEEGLCLNCGEEFNGPGEGS